MSISEPYDILLSGMNDLIEAARGNVTRFGEYDVSKTPFLKDPMKMARRRAETVLQTFASYDMVIKDLFSLTDGELDIIRSVNEKLHKLRGAHTFILLMRTHKDEVLEIVRHAGDKDLPANRKGFDQLGTMMGNAWKLKQGEPHWTPTDGDPRADSVIWGFVNGATNPLTDIHFIVCHGIERVATAHLHSKLDTEYINHKDWLLNAMTDVIALRGLQGKFPETKLLPLWTKKRPDGLGWISQERLKAYQEIVTTSR